MYPLYKLDTRKINLADWEELWKDIGDLIKPDSKESEALHGNIKTAMQTGSVQLKSRLELLEEELSNLVFRRIDQRVRKYCRSYHKEMDRRIFYTRYADDMLFSSAGTLEFDFCKNKNFKRMIAHILHQNGFSCNESKTIYAKGEISLSGYVVSNDVHLSRQKLCNINEVIYQFDQRKSYGSISYSLDKATVNIKNIMCNLNKRKMKKADGTVIQFDSLSDLVYYAAGCRSYLMQIASTEHGDTGFDKQIAKKIRKLEMILDYLSEELGEV